MQKLQSEENESSASDPNAKHRRRVTIALGIMGLMIVVLLIGFIWLIGWSVQFQSGMFMMKQLYDADLNQMELKIDSHLMDHRDGRFTDVQEEDVPQFEESPG